jgi:hypothetical protein
MSKKQKKREDLEWRYQPVLGSQGYAVVQFLKKIKPNERSQQYLQPPLIGFWLPYAFQKATFTDEQVKEAAWQSVYQLYHHLQSICQDFKLPLRVSLHNLNVESPHSFPEQFDEIEKDSTVQNVCDFLPISDDAEEFLQNFL